jgi:hypothetical protein
MAGQAYSVDGIGGYGAVPQLTSEVRHQAQPLIRFRQFTDIIEGYGGSKKGDTFNWDIISTLASTGGTLIETATIPRTNFTITQGTGEITEYGNAVRLIAALFSSFMHQFCAVIFGQNMAVMA